MGFSVNPLSQSVPDSAFESWLQDSDYLDSVFSLLTINPFSKLEADDFARDTPQWTTVFFGDCDSYSLPSSSQEARTRVHENTERFARNFNFSSFLSSGYQMPFALLGFVTSLVLWELFKFCSDRWEFHRHRLFSQIVICFAKSTTSLLAFLNVQMVIFYALAISYAVVILHGGLRNLSLSEKPS